MEHGADVNAQDKGGLIPLHNAASYGVCDVLVQLHDVTGKVQRARLIIATQKREVRVAALAAQFKFKNELIWNEKTSLAFG